MTAPRVESCGGIHTGEGSVVAQKLDSPYLLYFRAESWDSLADLTDIVTESPVEGIEEELGRNPSAPPATPGDLKSKQTVRFGTLG